MKRGEPDLLEGEVEAILDQWSKGDRALFEELVEDARSPLQRELIFRAAAARHSAAELHAFADALRPMTDAQVFDTCTISAHAQVPVTSRLRAEADPLFALELNGISLSPKLEDDPGPAYAFGDGKGRSRFRPPPALFAPVASPDYARKPKQVFEMESSTARGRPLDEARELGRSVETPSFKKDRAAEDSPLNEAVKVHGVAYREHRVDAGGLTLDKGLELAAAALVKGLPVVATLGRKAGELGRQALMLQVSTVGKSRAFQLHDPFAQETVWANERDLLGRAELPFDAKVWRRITALTLPVATHSSAR